MSIVLIGLNSFRNRGVEALAISAMQGIWRHMPNENVVLLSQDIEYNARRLSDPRVQQIYDPYWTSGAKMLRKIGPLSKVLAKRISPLQTKVEQIIKQASLLIASGGDNYSSDYGSPDQYIWPITYASMHKIPIYLMAQSIGPFKESRHRQLFMQAAQKVSAISVRESISYNYLVRELELPSNRITQTADTAFLLKSANEEQSESILKYYGIQNSRPRVAVSISGGISAFTTSNYQLHIQRIAEMIRWLLDTLNVQVIIIPHVIDTNPKNDDLLAASKVVNQLGWPTGVQIASADFTASEYKGIIARCDLLIAERMHAAIGGLSTGVPTVVISYSIKAPGITADVAGDALAGELVLPMEKFMEGTAIYPLVTNAWNKRSFIREQCNSRLPGVRERANLNFVMAANMLRK